MTPGGQYREVDDTPECPTCTTCPTCKNPTSPDCLSTKIPFGRMVHEPTMPHGSLLVRAFVLTTS